jgi:hypothetical protein
VSFDLIQKERERYQALIKETGEKVIKDELNRLFRKFPEIQAVTWYHYTPSFSDGDPCEFTLVGPQFLIDGYEGDSIEDEDDEWVDYESWLEPWDILYQDNWADGREGTEVQSPLYKAIKALKDLLKANKDVMEVIFGNFVRIVARPDGITVDEYYSDC